jgi:hypothetical protein
MQMRSSAFAEVCAIAQRPNLLIETLNLRIIYGHAADPMRLDTFIRPNWGSALLINKQLLRLYSYIWSSGLNECFATGEYGGEHEHC